MDHNWPYVVTGYALVALTLGGYGAWLRHQLRRANRQRS